MKALIGGGLSAVVKSSRSFVYPPFQALTARLQEAATSAWRPECRLQWAPSELGRLVQNRNRVDDPVAVVLGSADEPC